MKNAQERYCVRELARQVAEIAHSPENAVVQKRWRDVNGLRKPDRAPVWCRPVGVWREMLPEDELQCTDPWLRDHERRLRRLLIKHDIGDDEPFGECYAVDAVVDREPPNTYGVELRQHQPDVEWGSWRFDPPLKSEEDFLKLRMPKFAWDKAKNEETLARTDELLGDILPVKLVAGPLLDASLCATAARLMGLNELMLHMALSPDMIHRLMAYVRDTALAAVDAAEGSGYLTTNNTGPMTCSDPVGPEPENGRYTCKNRWVTAASQEFQLVSPAMWKEFLFDYQKPVLERFGYVQYGCCEDLTLKIDGVLSIPNLRIFVSSAWTDLDKVIDKVGQDYVIMWRQKASDVVLSDDTESIERHLEGGCKRLQGCYYQIILRELQTLAEHPKRLHEWTQIAIDKAEKYA